MKMTMTALALILTASVANALPGADATGCDPTAFVAVTNAAGEVLYWNNPTCQGVLGASNELSDADKAAK